MIELQSNKLNELKLEINMSTTEQITEYVNNLLKELKIDKNDYINSKYNANDGFINTKTIYKVKNND